MTLAKEINNLIINRPYQEPFTVDDLKADIKINQYRDQLTLNTIMNRLSKKGVVKQLKKGFYYRPKTNIFGVVPINEKEVIYKKYIQNNEHINGFTTGLTLYRQLGLTTQLANKTYYTSNLVTKRTKIFNELGIVIKPAKVKITKENYIYLQIVELFDDIHTIHIEVDNYIQIIQKFINDQNIDFIKCLYYAKTYYSTKTVMNMMDYIGALDYETAL